MFVFSIDGLSLPTMVCVFCTFSVVSDFSALIDFIASSVSWIFGVAKLWVRRRGIEGSGSRMSENLLKISVYVELKIPRSDALWYYKNAFFAFS